MTDYNNIEFTVAFKVHGAEDLAYIAKGLLMASAIKDHEAILKEVQAKKEELGRLEAQIELQKRKPTKREASPVG